MKELKTIQEILKTQIAIEKELKDAIISKVPEVSEKLVSTLFDLIEKESKNFRIAMKPCIVLNYEDSVVYIRLFPLEVGARFKYDFERRNVYPSYQLDELFDVKDSELYDPKFREELCKMLSEGIKDVLASETCGCKCTITRGKDSSGYSAGDVEFIVTPKIL